MVCIWCMKHFWYTYTDLRGKHDNFFEMTGKV